MCFDRSLAKSSAHQADPCAQQQKTCGLRYLGNRNTGDKGSVVSGSKAVEGKRMGPIGRHGERDLFQHERSEAL